MFARGLWRDGDVAGHCVRNSVVSEVLIHATKFHSSQKHIILLLGTALQPGCRCLRPARDAHAPDVLLPWRHRFDSEIEIDRGPSPELLSTVAH